MPDAPRPFETFVSRPFTGASARGPSFFTDETLKTFLFGASIGPDGLSDCFLLPAKPGVDVPPRLLARNDPLWKVIYRDIETQSRAFGTQLTAREDAIEVRGT